MSDATNNARSVVQIDELNLDKECIRLPSDYLKYAHLSVNAKTKVDEIDNRLKVDQAELTKDIRANPTNYGIDKVTESAISAAVLSDVGYQRGMISLLKAQHEAKLAEAVVWALEHKKRSLTLLVELHGLGYFSSPKVSERGRGAVEQMTQRHVRRSEVHED